MVQTISNPAWVSQFHNTGGLVQRMWASALTVLLRSTGDTSNGRAGAGLYYGQKYPEESDAEDYPRLHLLMSRGDVDNVIFDREAELAWRAKRDTDHAAVHAECGNLVFIIVAYGFGANANHAVAEVLKSYVKLWMHMVRQL